MRLPRANTNRLDRATLTVMNVRKKYFLIGLLASAVLFPILWVASSYLRLQLVIFSNIPWWRLLAVILSLMPIVWGIQKGKAVENKTVYRKSYGLIAVVFFLLFVAAVAYYVYIVEAN